MFLALLFALQSPVQLPARWEYSTPFIAPEKREHDPSRAQKDPSIVFHDGRWHVFMTVKLPDRTAPGVEAWTDNVSHGELIRAGVDQRMTVDPKKLRFVFQGMLERAKSGQGYGQFQWRIGILTPVER